MTSAPHDVRVGVLGPLLIESDGQPIGIRSSKERSLLTVLALAHSTVVESHHLAHYLWPDDPPPSAAKTLQGYIARLRTRIGRDTIMSAPTGYSLHHDTSVDIAEFERYLALARDPEVAPTTKIAHLSDSLALVRGPLPTEWELTPLRDDAVRITEAIETARTEWLDARLEGELHGEYIDELEDAVRRQPLNEHRWALLMAALYRCGRQAEALRAYSRARNHLAELGLEPGIELSRMEHAVLEHRANLPPAQANPPERPEIPLALVRHVRGLIVGRDQELAALSERWNRALHGTFESAAVVGPAGSGKTALLAIFANSITSGRVLHADLGTNSHPTAPSTSPLADRGSDDLIGQALTAASSTHQDEQIDTAHTPPDQTGTAPHLIGDQPNDGLTELLRSTTDTQPTLLILDDFDAASPTTTAGWLRLCAARPAGLMVVIAHRPIAEPPNRPLAAPQDATATIELGPLTNIHLRALAESMLGDHVVNANPAVIDELAHHSGGLPGAAWEHLRHIVGRQRRE